MTARAAHRDLQRRRACLRPAVAGVCLVALAAAVLGAPPAGVAQTLRNHGAGAVASAALDTSLATVTLVRALPQAPPSVAEITPSRVGASAAGAQFDLDVKPTIGPGVMGVSRIEIDVPAGFAAVAVRGVSVAGAPLAAACPTPGAGQYCPTVAGTSVSIVFGDPVTADQARISVQIEADAPAARGLHTFACRVANATGVIASTAGDANGVADDANSLAVLVYSSVDVLRSTVTADPPVVLADGVAVSTVTTTILDATGRPLPGRTVLLSSSRDGLDTIVQPAAATDSSGVARGTIRSLNAGTSLVTATVTSDSLALPQQPAVTFTQGLALRLGLTVDRERALLGEVVTYTITLANLTTRPVTPVRVASALPPAFRYLAGSAARDGTAIADPAPDGSLTFDLDAVPALVDGNGNGAADPGEPGYVTVRYRAVIGSGATPGAYVNSAVARDACAQCVISNTASAQVDVVTDPLFSLGTIVGRVFEDADGDGRQGPGEPGVSGARVALDDGTYALTDRRGLYHFPAVSPGHRLVKVDLHSLPGVARAVGQESRLLTVTSGLLEKADFGVRFERELVQVVGQAGPPARSSLPAWAAARVARADSVAAAAAAAALAAAPTAASLAAPAAPAGPAMAPDEAAPAGTAPAAGAAPGQQPAPEPGPTLRPDTTPAPEEFPAPVGIPTIEETPAPEAAPPAQPTSRDGTATAALPPIPMPALGPATPAAAAATTAVTAAAPPAPAAAPTSDAPSTPAAPAAAPEDAATSAGPASNEPMPDLEATLPPDGARLSSADYPVAGRTDPRHTVTVNGLRVPVGADGRFAATVPLPPGTQRVVITATDSTGRVARIERSVQVDRDRVFLVALADGAVGRLQGSGFLRDRQRRGDQDLYTEGRVAYYLRGVVRGKYLITSAYDSGIDEFATFFDQVDDATNERLIANLDPDRFYPVYGDSSATVYDAQRRGRFFLAVESEELRAAFGSAAVAFDGGELASFRRTLSGAQVEWRSASHTPGGERRTALSLVGAQAGQVHVRDELRGTGGSLYYLSHRDILEGSEQVAVTVRDQNTGLVLARVPQLRGADYTVKSREGRLLFTRPVASVAEAASLISREALAGNPIVIEVDYETRAEDLGRSLTGARARQYVTDHLALGGTYVRDELDVTPYELQGVDGELRIGRGSRLAVEAGKSTGVGGRVYASADGGLTFAEATPAGAADGAAWRAAADLDVGEWFGRAGKSRLRGYVKQVEPGFVSSGNLAERGTTKAGAGAEVDLASAGRLSLRWDAERPRDALAGGTGVRSDLFGAQWVRDAKTWGLAAEMQSRDVTGRDGGTIEDTGLLSGRVWSRLRGRLTGRLEHQQTVDGARRDQTTLGLLLQASSRLGFEAKGATGTAGRAAQAGATLAVGDVSMYVTERVTDDRLGAGRATVVGTQTQFGTSGRLYTEYQWQRLGGTDRTASLFGAQRQWRPGQTFQLSLSGEHGQTGTGGQKTRRTALATAFTFAPPLGLKLTAQEEVRFETGAQDRIQWLTSNLLELRLGNGLTALGRWRWGQTRDRRTDRIEARLEEHGLGLALRPESGNGPNALARYTRLADIRSAGAGLDGAGGGLGGGGVPAGGPTVTSGTMDVLSLEGAVDLPLRTQWSAKAAARVWHSGPPDSSAVTTHSTLLVNRLDAAIAGPFGLGVEYRVLSQREADDRRRGWLNELTWDVERHVRVGLGYNFTDFTDDEFSRHDSSLGGWFLRLQGRY